MKSNFDAASYEFAREASRLERKVFSFSLDNRSAPTTDNWQALLMMAAEMWEQAERNTSCHARAKYYARRGEYCRSRNTQKFLLMRFTRNWGKLGRDGDTCCKTISALLPSQRLG